MAGNPWKNPINDIMIRILTDLASEGIHDYWAARGTCRGWRNVPEEFICRFMDMENFYWFNWFSGDQYTDWFERCVMAGNPQAMYYKGLEVFADSWNVRHSASVFLKRSQAARYLPAIYGYGIVTLYYGNRRVGLPALNSLREDGETDSAFSRKVETLRDNTRNVLRTDHQIVNACRTSWKNNLRCRCKSNCPLVTEDWLRQWSTLVNLCKCSDRCYWDHEASLALNGTVIILPDADGN